ncbi:MAG: GDSL-type esterase/lipase family protein [Candidatus Obscuribacterales bacterium]|jgi:lysophospholipase L1-like esterase
MYRWSPLLWALLLIFAAFRFTVGKVFAGSPQASDPQASEKISATARVANVDLNRFAEAVRAFEVHDQKHPPAQGATVFVGSSTFAHWTTLEREFADLGAINRGFGGSTIPEVIHYSERVVLKYKPRRVVFYAGTNDIGELGHSGQRVAQDFEKFVGIVHGKLPRTDIYFISLSVAPVRLQNASEFRDGNQRIRAYCHETPRVHFIDVTPVMREKDGRLKEELFGPDRLHMNEKGYALWIPVIRKALSH